MTIPSHQNRVHPPMPWQEKENPSRAVPSCAESLPRRVVVPRRRRHHGPSRPISTAYPHPPASSVHRASTTPKPSPATTRSPILLTTAPSAGRVARGNARRVAIKHTVRVLVNVLHCQL